ncbi:MOSC domain-containing protein [Falsirhodobacter xinxiangensis]|uniref:MOSC domain-containing protein n=1 Tax=Falsirhodobacter xinxiangensis TaxID=2530049 RepID=UPI0010AAF93D|nr:sulfurase [Rhodobacter xinxiangensis]
MPALIATTFAGRIAWLGLVRDRKALVSEPVKSLIASFAGPEGDVHAGMTRSSCVRVAQQYKRGTRIRNTRQFSILSASELRRIAAEMGLERLDPALLGATVVIEGIPDLSLLPPSSRLQAEGGATLVVDMQNHPCTLPARVIEAAHPGHGEAFKPAAAGLRGITAWTEAEGMLRLGAQVRLHLPAQPAWPHLDAKR